MNVWKISAHVTSHKRRGFLFTMPLMLGMGIIVFSSMIAISQLFITVGGPMVPDLLSDMPTLFHYTADGQRMPEFMPAFVHDSSSAEKDFAEMFPSLAMYGLMVKIALGIFVVLLMLAGVSYFFEEFNIVKQGTAYGIITKMLVLVPIYFVLPYMWDMVALVIESSSLYLMDPFGGDPHSRTTELWCMMGSAACSIDGATVDPLVVFDGMDNFDRNATLSQDSWSNSLQSPFFGEGFIVNVLLSLFKGFSVMFMTAMMFVLSAIRVMLTEVIVIAFPLVSAIGLIPWINTNRISDMFQQNLIGLAMAPIMSAIVLSIGLSAIDEQSTSPLRIWFQLLSVGFLAVFFPVILSPMLGNLSTKVGHMVSTAVTSASMAGSSGLRGAASGMSQASGTMKGMGLGNTGGQAGGNGQGRFSSADVGGMTSGVNLGGVSAMDKIKMYGTAGAIGMLSGIGAGMVQGTTHGAGMPGMGSGISNQMMHVGDSRIDQIAQHTAINNIAGTMTGQMTGIETALGGSQGTIQIDKSTALNPGDHLNSMTQNSRSFDAGEQLAHDPGKKQQFMDMYQKKMNLGDTTAGDSGYFEHKVDTMIKHHPIAAGKMFNDMKSGSQGSK